jgi:hypothetical protein
LATILNIDSARINILSVKSGSVIVTFEVLPSSNPTDPSSSAVLNDLATLVEQNSTALQTYGIDVMNYTIINSGATTTSGSGSSTTGGKS